MNKFYSLNKILAKNATYNLIIGERSNGKTYAVLKYGLEHYFKTGGQIAIVRRWKEDITGRRAKDIFSALIANNEVEKLSNGKYSSIYYYGGKFYVCNYDENGKVLYNDEDVLGVCFALSENEHNKSISYPKIETILFDEFLTKTLYLKDEFVLFLNTLSTIIRLRTNVKIFMCGNTVNKYSPYFQEMGLKHIQEMEQGTIDVYKYGNTKLTVAVEYCASNQSTKKNNYYFAFNNPKLEMITSGKWELDIYPHLPQKYISKQILFTFFINFDYNLFQCEVIQYSNGIIIYCHEKTTPIKDTEKDLIYSLEDSEKWNFCKNIFRPNFEIGKKIVNIINHNKIFYQNNDVGNTINNYFKICKNMV